MLEIANPCAEAVCFDHRGFPMAQCSGHGMGVRSIAAFCQKRGAVCRFELTDGMFRLQLIL